MNTAIIPARGGSKRIPGKNIKSFHGKPLICHSIEAAQKSGLFDSIVVSTDSEEIAKVAREAGAEVPFIRPAELSDDHAPTDPVLLHALRWLVEAGREPERFCGLYANPFIRARDLVEAHDELIREKATTVTAVCRFGYPILRAYKLTEQGTLTPQFPEYRKYRSQDLPESYHDAGQFWWHDARFFLDQNDGKRTREAKILPFVLREHFSYDLDTMDDWAVAAKLYTAFKE